MKYAVTGIGIFSGLIALVWLLQSNDFFMYKEFAPKYEQARRETFEQSKSYRQGMVQELETFRAQYITATPAQQDALASIILHRCADFDESAMPSDLREFVKQLRNKRTGEVK